MYPETVIFVHELFSNQYFIVETGNHNHEIAVRIAFDLVKSEHFKGKKTHFKEEVPISKSVLEGFLTSHCPYCEDWKEDGNGFGCCTPQPISYCHYFREIYEREG